MQMKTHLILLLVVCSFIRLQALSQITETETYTYRFSDGWQRISLDKSGSFTIQRFNEQDSVINTEQGFYVLENETLTLRTVNCFPEYLDDQIQFRIFCFEDTTRAHDSIRIEIASAINFPIKDIRLESGFHGFSGDTLDLNDGAPHRYDIYQPFDAEHTDLTVFFAGQSVRVDSYTNYISVMISEAPGHYCTEYKFLRVADGLRVIPGWRITYIRE
jgi:hypothetical protein